MQDGHVTRIEPIRCLTDNYAWLVTSDARKGEAVVVDPGEAAPVLAALKQRELSLVALVITHHHHDHIGGILEILNTLPAQASVQVVAGRYDVERCRVPHATKALSDQESVELLGVQWQAMFTPGHTKGATSYLLTEELSVFTGDTLFRSGCGRLLEGDARAHYASMRRLAALPPATAIYCGHEYTLKNLQFARSILPADEQIARALKAAHEARAKGAPTVPGRIGDEHALNLFFRCEDEEVARAVQAAPGLKTFASLRERRDRF